MTQSNTTYAVSIDRSKCVGSGNCVMHAEGVFDQDDLGFAIVTDLGARSVDVVEFAASSCPMAAITFTRQAGTPGAEG